jgi:uncharacterized membrane-anchored protein
MKDRDALLRKFGFEGNEVAKAMPLIQILIFLIVVGVVLYLINEYIPMASSIKSILNAVVVIAVIIWLLSVFGLLSSTPRVHIG